MNELRSRDRVDIDELSDHVLRRAARADTLDGRFAGRELRRREEWVRHCERVHARQRRRYRLSVWKTRLEITAAVVVLYGLIIWGVLWLVSR